MNEKFENQKETLLSIKHEISLLYQQINYLLRNEKALGLLDLDVLMNRTHTIYDLLCSVNLGEELNEEDLPIDAEALSGLFGGMVTEGEDKDEDEAPLEEETSSEPESVIEPEPVQEPEPDPVFEPAPEPVIEPEPEPVAQPQPEVEPSAPALNP